MKDIIFWAIIIIAIAITLLVAYSLCVSASRSDKISREQWKEYWRKEKERMQGKAQKSYEAYRERFANDYGKTIEEATECQAVKNYKEYLEEHYKEYDVVICEKVGD